MYGTMPASRQVVQVAKATRDGAGRHREVLTGSAVTWSPKALAPTARGATSSSSAVRVGARAPAARAQMMAQMMVQVMAHLAPVPVTSTAPRASRPMPLAPPYPMYRDACRRFCLVTRVAGLEACMISLLLGLAGRSRRGRDGSEGALASGMSGRSCSGEEWSASEGSSELDSRPASSDLDDLDADWRTRKTSDTSASAGRTRKASGTASAAEVALPAPQLGPPPPCPLASRVPWSGRLTLLQSPARGSCVACAT